MDGGRKSRQRLWPTRNRVGPSSFLPGTLVLMADGTRKPIEKIKPGDRVLATDPLTGRSSPSVVVAALTSAGVKHLVAVTVDTDGPAGDRTGTVTATDIHPFWVQDPIHRAGPNLPPGHWTNAEDLHVGDLLRSPDGTLHPITAVATYTRIQQVHNLTTDTTHTYNVLAGPDPTLVHNACGTPPPNLSPPGAGRRGAFRQAKRDSGIPVNQQPSTVGPNLDRRGAVQPGRKYEFEVRGEDGKIDTKVIRDDAGGHHFEDDPTQDRGPHFNTENDDHYDY